jgi:predicted ATPase
MDHPGILREIHLKRETVEDFERYPFSIPAIHGMTTLRLHPHVTYLVGENGSGKSTLIEALAIATGFNAEGGSKNANFSTRPSESSLHAHLRPVRGSRREKGGFFLRAETMFNLATEAENHDYGWPDLHAKSHGEALLWLVAERFKPNGLYLLDEPESALSPQRQLAFLRNMFELVGEGAQFIIATHSPLLMAYPGALIYCLDESGIRALDYEDTEHYQLTKGVLDNPSLFFRRLFSDDEEHNPVES